jgi:hypothetical protein
MFIIIMISSLVFIIILMGKMIETHQSGCDFGQSVLRISRLGWLELDFTSPTERPGGPVSCRVFEDL